MSNETHGRTIAWDFDGTLHPYRHGWTGSRPDDHDPIPGARETMASLAAAGFRQVIYSCRADHPEGDDGIRWWLEKYDLAQYIDAVTHLKPHADAYIDDRGVEFTGDNWDAVLARVEVLTTPREYEPVPADGGTVVRFFDDNREVGADDFVQARDRLVSIYGSSFEQLIVNKDGTTERRLISPPRIQVAPA